VLLILFMSPCNFWVRGRYGMTLLLMIIGSLLIYVWPAGDLSTNEAPRVNSVEGRGLMFRDSLWLELVLY